LKPAGKSGAGSEYCNHTESAGNVICKHKKNPEGVLCSNCGKKSHNRAHCFAKGDGIEGQGPKLKAKAKEKPELTAIASGWSSELPTSGKCHMASGKSRCT
jgi:hypothetical protein